MRIALIAAVSQNDVIGRGGELPWRLSADLRRFRERTMGRAIILGRRTWDSIGRPLPRRVSIVVTRDANWSANGAIPAPDLSAAIAAAGEADCEQDEAFIIGGGEIYRAALPIVDRIYLTRVRADVDGDVTFPDIDWTAWKCTADEPHDADDRNDHPFAFQTWEPR